MGKQKFSAEKQDIYGTKAFWTEKYSNKRKH